MKIKLYQVDAFAEEIFTGNPAAICPLGKEWLDENIMQKIANENNLSETAFYIKNDNQYEIRWFTPKSEVELCGHATLATAYVIYELEEKGKSDEIKFMSKSGILNIRKEKDFIYLNFPSDNFNKVNMDEKLYECFNIKPIEIYKGKFDYMLVYNTKEEIEKIEIDFNKMSKIETRGIIITARGEKEDFVSRFFAPKVGVNEDPVTGSAHTTLIKYWSKKLDKNIMTATQLSDRKGNLKCKDLGDRIEIGGKGYLYLEGSINI